MGRLSKLRIVDPILTNLALGYTNAELVAHHLMPFVSVDKEGGKIPKFGKEAFKLYNTERALRAKSNRINPETIGSVDVVLDEHDLEFPIDYREEAEAAFPLQAHGTHVTTEGIRLRHEKMVADLSQNAANYAASNKIALSGTSCFTNAASDPLGVVGDAKDAIRQKIGRDPNTAIIGPSTLKALKKHAAILDRIKFTQRGIITADLLRDLFEIENIQIGKAIWSTDADVFGDIWSDNIVLAYVPTARAGSERTPYEPSYGYTLRKKGQPQVDTRTEDGKVELIRNTDIFRPYLLGAEAGYLISNTNE